MMQELSYAGDAEDNNEVKPNISNVGANFIHKIPSNSSNTVNLQIHDGVVGFCNKEYKWVSSFEQHDCKCFQEYSNNKVKTNDTASNPSNFHFCGADENFQCFSEKFKPPVQNKILRKPNLYTGCSNIDVEALRKSCTFQIRLTDIYSTNNSPTEAEKLPAPEPKYQKGSLVWAKVQGYPKWPAMIDEDPDYKIFYWTGDSKVEYHVVFFDDKKLVSRFWSPDNQISPFTLTTKVRFNKVSIFKRFQVAFREAVKASSMTVEERLEKYSFEKRLQSADVRLVED